MRIFQVFLLIIISVCLIACGEIEKQQQTAPPEILHLNIGDTKAAKGMRLFNANCSACHKLRGDLIGPPLEGVAQRRNREWLYRYIRNSRAMIASGDSLAVALAKEYNYAQMSFFQHFTDEDIDAILAYTK